MGVKEVIVDYRSQPAKFQSVALNTALKQPSRHQGQRLMRRWPRIANWLAASLVSC
jgi:hypothetical protein